SAKYRQRWLREEAVPWPRLSEPRALVQSWLDKAAVELLGSDRIAHDLWAAQEVPAMALVDRLVLALAGFDLTCAIRADGRSCEIVPITRPLTQARLETMLQRLPDDAAQPKATRQRKAKPTTDPTTNQRFTLKLENRPLGHVLDQFEQQLQLEVVWSTSELLTARQQLVSCEVQDVELDELLRSLLDRIELQHSREGRRVRIEAKR
ncbi:MAG: hypothetical protein ACR2NM_14090, partial [Bythopirellula sp.]